jgi:FixJ family two-component response regulator
MKKYSFEVTIEAITQQEAEVKLTAASTLMQKLTAREIAVLAQVVKNDPIKTALAKKALGL